MAEFLIFIRSATKRDPGPGHWLDAGGVYDEQVSKIVDETPVLELATKLEELQDMNLSKTQVGDIIKKYPDGKLNRCDVKTYAVLKVPDFDAKDIIVAPVIQPSPDPDNIPPKLLRKFRHNVAPLALKLGEIRIITEKDFYAALTDKADLLNG